ncbi:MAG: tetratricopeptide repeat protein [Candidatus Stahlbacteria bacterium]|nr:tetratricopeptide repeat protein [Candidatus Stahlbacteria bacterium]
MIFLIFLLTTNTDSLVKYYLDIGQIDMAEKSCNLCDTFLLAEIAYFNYRYGQAVEYYNAVSPNSKYSNDALYRLMLIKSNEEKILQSYTTAELLCRSKESERGIQELKKLIAQGGLTSDSTTKNTITTWVYLLLIEVLRKSNNFDEAIKTSKSFISQFPDNDKLPQVKLKLGSIYATMGNREKAKEIYKEIILRHSTSSIAHIAREELDNL